MLKLIRKTFLPPILHRAMGDEINPHYGIGRAWEVIKFDFKHFGKSQYEIEQALTPRHTDILIIGGGIMGFSIAYWLKQRCPEGFNCIVVERDPTYRRAATTLAVGGIRQQFSIAENIQMSLFSAQFLRNIRQHLSVLDLDPPDLQFNPQGYLFLSSHDGAAMAEENHKLQISLGAKVKLMTPAQLEKKFPWLNTDGIALGSFGLENEGWFDPWSLLEAFKRKALSLGVKYIKGEVIGFEQERRLPGMEKDLHDKLVAAIIKPSEGEIFSTHFAICINAAGPLAGHIAKLAEIGTGERSLSISLPVEPRKRFVYVFHCNQGYPGIECPLVVDPSGIYFRREDFGGNFICGLSPTPEEEPDISNLDVDYEFFDRKIWHTLAKRVPAFESIKIKGGWAGYYDYNTFDQNAIIGNHPYHQNMIFANGFSGHGIQQAPAVGRAVMELLFDGQYKTIDLTRFGFKRIIFQTPLKEAAVV